MKYMMCLSEGNYDVLLSEDRGLMINDLMQMCDNLINLLLMYGVTDEEIIDEINNDVDAEITPTNI